VDEAVDNFAEWIPNDRLRNWLGVDPDTDADHLARLARRLSGAVAEVQSARASQPGSNALFGRLAVLQWQPNQGSADGARVGTFGGVVEELTLLLRHLSKLTRTLILLEGPGAASIAGDVAFVGTMPACDVVVEGAPAAADARVVIAPWSRDRLASLLERRAPAGADIPAWAIVAAAESAEGNPREALRRLRLALSATVVLDKA
jgi:hypothetical protein